MAHVFHSCKFSDALKVIIVTLQPVTRMKHTLLIENLVFVLFKLVQFVRLFYEIMKRKLCMKDIHGGPACLSLA